MNEINNNCMTNKIGSDPCGLYCKSRAAGPKRAEKSRKNLLSSTINRKKKEITKEIIKVLPIYKVSYIYYLRIRFPASYKRGNYMNSQFLEDTFTNSANGAIK